MAIAKLKNVKISYDRSGVGEPMLFIQGVGCAGCTWKPQTDILRKNFDCVYFDNRGIGESSENGHRFTIDLLADDAIGLLDALAIDQAHIVGHSMGGLIALEMAIHHPERIASLSLICSLRRGKDAMKPTFPMLKHGLFTNVGTVSMRRRAFARMVSSPSHIAVEGIDSVVQTLRDTFQRDIARLPSVASKQMQAMFRHDSSHLLGKVAAVPSIVIAGMDDPIGRPALSEQLALDIKALETHILEGESHALPIQSSKKINHLIKEHALKHPFDTKPWE